MLQRLVDQRRSLSTVGAVAGEAQLEIHIERTHERRVVTGLARRLRDDTAADPREPEHVHECQAQPSPVGSTLVEPAGENLTAAADPHHGAQSSPTPFALDPIIDACSSASSLVAWLRPRRAGLTGLTPPARASSGSYGERPSVTNARKTRVLDTRAHNRVPNLVLEALAALEQKTVSAIS